MPPLSPEHVGRKCLVLDLDETLVHSSFKVCYKTDLWMVFVVEISKAIQQADFIVPVEIEYQWHHFHVLKRPGVDNFLKKMGEIYEIVIFTASLSKVEMLLSVIMQYVDLVNSMPIRSLISLISIKWWHIGYSGRVVIVTRAIMSR